MATSTASPPKSSFGSLLLRHVLGILFCIGVPVLITTMVPVSRLNLERNGETVTATARTCLLFWIPFKTVTVSPFSDLEWDHKTGEMSRYRRTGRRDDYVKAEDTGYLTLKGPNHSATIEVSPHDLDSAIGKIDAFMNNPAETRLSLFLPANWKFGIIGGGLMSLFIPLYLGSFLVAAVRAAMGKPPLEPHIVRSPGRPGRRLP